MARVIWKYPLGNSAFQSLDVPMDYKILAVQLQRNIPCLWIEVQSDNPKERLDLVINSTGLGLCVFSDVYIGTFQLFDGQEVYHLYRRSNY